MSVIFRLNVDVEMSLIDFGDVNELRVHFMTKCNGHFSILIHSCDFGCQIAFVVFKKLCLISYYHRALNINLLYWIISQNEGNVYVDGAIYKVCNETQISSYDSSIK